MVGSPSIFDVMLWKAKGWGTIIERFALLHIVEIYLDEYERLGEDAVRWSISQAIRGRCLDPSGLPGGTKESLRIGFVTRSPKRSKQQGRDRIIGSQGVRKTSNPVRLNPIFVRPTSNVEYQAFGTSGLTSSKGTKPIESSVPAIFTVTTMGSF